MPSPMFLNAAHFLNTPTHKIVLFLLFEFSLEVFNSSITLLSATTKREAIVFISRVLSIHTAKPRVRTVNLLNRTQNIWASDLFDGKI